MATINVRYVVVDVDAAIAFHLPHQPPRLLACCASSTELRYLGQG